MDAPIARLGHNGGKERDMAGLFGFIRRKKDDKGDPRGGKKAKRGRPTAEMAAERRLQRLKDAEIELKILELERKKKELLAGQSEKRPLTHEDVLRVVDYLRELGLEIRSKGGGKTIDDGGVRALLREIADSKMGESLGGSLAQLLAGRPALLPPAENPPPTAPPAAPSQEENVDPSLIIINQLQNKTPDQAAAWIISRTEPQAKILARTLASTPDDQIGELLDAYAAQAPGLVRWLRARPDWLIALVHALRARFVTPARATEVGL